MQNAMTQHFGETIYQYTRESAIEDGYLVDVTVYSIDFEQSFQRVEQSFQF